ncbi:MAG: class I SAM-dependent RNA methyltransferase [Anaerolineae bacterium]|nr:class I SAM-dependent RNA methyltransferase [Anaerolineae bacterium]
MAEPQPLPQEVEVELTDIANGGQALGRVAGKTVFVPYALPGEVVRVRLVDDRGRYAFAEGLHLLEASADRVLPRCAHFGPGKCGGCTWQHMAYSAQVALKTDIVLDQLERVGGFADVPVAVTLACPDAWHNRLSAMLYPLAGGGLGFARVVPGAALAIEECHVITPALLALVDQLDFALEGWQWVELRDNSLGDLMVTLRLAAEEAPELEIDFKASVNLLLAEDEPVNLVGATHLRYPLRGQSYRVTAGCFMRHNIAQLEALLDLVQRWGGLAEGGAVLDLYSGSGLLASALAPLANHITCVDQHPPAMTDAEENLAAYGHVDLIEGAVEDVLEDLEAGYDLLILDPPAEGLSLAAVDALEAVLPRRALLVYEDPAVLARDAKRLHGRYGYQLQVVQPIDFAPQSYRVTTLAQMERKP